MRSVRGKSSTCPVGRQCPRVAARTPLEPTYRGSCRRFSLVGEVAALRGGGRMLRRSQATCAADSRARGRRSRRGRRRHHGAGEAHDRARPTATRRSGDPGSRLAPGLDVVPFGPCCDRVCCRDRGRHASPRFRIPSWSLQARSPCRACISGFTSGRTCSSEASSALRSASRLPVSSDGTKQSRHDAGGIPDRPESASLVSVDRRDRHPGDVDVAHQQRLQVTALGLVAVPGDR